MTFDMQKARQAAVELVGRTQLPLPDRLDREQRALGLFPAALDEIERQAKRIAELEADRFVAERNRQWVSEKFGAKIVRQRATLKKLGEKVRARGKALVEERANLIEAGGEPIRKRLSEDDQKDLDDLAREQLRSEGKIGSGNHFRGFLEMVSPDEQVGTGVFLMHRRGPMLTKEQQATLERCELLLRLWGNDADDDEAEKITADIIVLRLLLSSASPAWEATEERERAINRAVRGMVDPNYHHSDVEKECANVLRGMLEEARP